MAGRWYPGVDTERVRRQIRKLRELQAIAAAARNAPKGCQVCGKQREPAEASQSFFPCCSEACHVLWEVELGRRDEVKEARRLGIPVAVYRQQKNSTDRDGEK